MNLLLLFIYKLGVLFSRTPASQIEQNKKSNMNHLHLIKPKEFIENQHSLSDLQMGNKSIAFCGCGAVAVYNVLLGLFNSVDTRDFLSVIGNFEKKGLTLKGRFGISPTSIRDYFRKNNFHVDSTFSTKPEKINAIGEADDAFVCTIYNKKNNLFGGIHHVAVTKDKNGNFISHNPYTESKTLSDAINRASLYNGSAFYTIGVKKP